MQKVQEQSWKERPNKQDFWQKQAERFPEPRVHGHLPRPDAGGCSGRGHQLWPLEVRLDHVQASRSPQWGTEWGMEGEGVGKRAGCTRALPTPPCCSSEHQGA